MISFIHEDLFKKDSVKKDLVITDRNEVSLTNSDIYLESFELTEVLCDEEDLNFGLCNAASVKFTTSYFVNLLLFALLTRNNNNVRRFDSGQECQLYDVI